MTETGKHTKGHLERSAEYAVDEKAQLGWSGFPGRLRCFLELIRHVGSLAKVIHASDLEGGMTVSGPSNSRMTRPLGTG
jgi:hypothetical protein